MKITIPKTVKIVARQKTRSFNCPEGNFRGRLFEVKPVPARDPVDPRIRVMFETFVPWMPDQQVMTRKDFPPDLGTGSPLRRFLEQWLGDDSLDNQEELDFDLLIGTEAELTIVHFHNEKYANPYCDIKGAFPPGNLALTDQPDDSGKNHEAGKSVATGPLKHNTSIMPFVGPYGRDIAQFASLLKQLTEPKQPEPTSPQSPQSKNN